MKRSKVAVAVAGLMGASIAAGGVALAGTRAHRGPAGETGGEAAYTAAHRGEAEVSAAQAERAANGTRPGRAFDTHLENEGNGLRWEVKTDDGSQVWEVQVDAGTGKVVSNQPDE